MRLPHVLTSLREDERGVVDEALAKLGLARTVALTTPRFVAVPFLVAGAPVVTTMPARLARFFAATLGLSLSPAPVELPEVSGLAALARLLRPRPGACVAASDHRARRGTRSRESIARSDACGIHARSWARMPSRASAAAARSSFWRSRYTRIPSRSSRMSRRLRALSSTRSRTL